MFMYRTVMLFWTICSSPEVQIIVQGCNSNISKFYWIQSLFISDIYKLLELNTIIIRDWISCVKTSCLKETDERKGSDK